MQKAELIKKALNALNTNFNYSDNNFNKKFYEILDIKLIN